MSLATRESLLVELVVIEGTNLRAIHTKRDHDKDTQVKRRIRENALKRRL